MTNQAWAVCCLFLVVVWNTSCREEHDLVKEDIITVKFVVRGGFDLRHKEAVATGPAGIARPSALTYSAEEAAEALRQLETARFFSMRSTSAEGWADSVETTLYVKTTRREHLVSYFEHPDANPTDRLLLVKLAEKLRVASQ